MRKAIDVSALPKPLKQGALLLSLAAACNDHATVETAKVKVISDVKVNRSQQLRPEWKELGFRDVSEFDEYASHPLFGFYCSNHKSMLLAKHLRETDHLWLFEGLPDELDSGEFRTSNFADMLQLQLSKLFGHTKLPYAFGHGVIKFRAWMEDKYPHEWRGIKRLVGNRVNIFLENAVVMYYMTKYYMEYCNWVMEEAKAGSSLHSRIAPKLRNPKMMSAMRARAIMFLHVSQPLRVACKSSGYVDGRAPSQLDIAPVWCRLLQEVDRLIDNPRLLLQKTYNVFDGMSDSMTESINRYRTNVRSSDMVDKVFEPAPWIDDETLLIIKADVMALKVRLTSKSGGCAEFLPGGAFENWRTDERLRDIMSRVNATSDCIESVFGVLDNIFKYSSDNISKHSGKMMHYYCHMRLGFLHMYTICDMQAKRWLYGVLTTPTNGAAECRGRYLCSW